MINNILIINMDKDVDRLDKIKKSAELFNIKFTRVPGVRVDDQYINTSPYISDFMKKYGTKGMIGGFLAHKSVWEVVVKNNLEYAIILEDDIVFNENFNSSIDEILKDIHKLDFDVLLLGSLVGGKPTKDYNFLDKISKFFLKSNEYKYIDDKYHTPEFFGGSHAYIIKYESAKKLLEKLSIVTYYIDLVISSCKDIKIIALNNSLINTSSDNRDLSNNSTTQYYLDKYFKKIFIYEKNLSWMLNISLFKISLPNSQTPLMINSRFIIKYLIIFIITLLCTYYDIYQPYWSIILLLFIIIILL